MTVEDLRGRGRRDRPLDSLRTAPDSRAPLGDSGAPICGVPRPVVGPDAPGHGARDLPGDARDAGKPPRPRGGGRQSSASGRAEEPGRALRARQAAPSAVPRLRRQGPPRRLRQVVRLQDADRRARSSPRRFPISLCLGTHGLRRWRSPAGSTLGILAAVHQNRGWDYLSVSLATFGVAVPNFVLAVFRSCSSRSCCRSSRPAAGTRRVTGCCRRSRCRSAPMGIIARYTRASMLEVIRADYTLTARAKGLARAAGDLQARAEERADPDRDPPRAPVRRHRHRLVLRGGDLPRARHGPVLRAVDDRPRLSDDHGGRPHVRRVPRRS